jgi:four helix bundle protein
MAPYRDLDVLDAARLAADDVNQLIESTPRILHRAQLSESAQSVPANISEGVARGTGPDRARALRIAKGSADETIQHLQANWHAERIDVKTYWRMHNRLVVIGKMLASLLRHPDCNPSASAGKRKRTPNPSRT